MLPSDEVFHLDESGLIEIDDGCGLFVETRFPAHILSGDIGAARGIKIENQLIVEHFAAVVKGGVRRVTLRVFDTAGEPQVCEVAVHLRAGSANHSTDACGSLTMLLDAEEEDVDFVFVGPFGARAELTLPGRDQAEALAVGAAEPVWAWRWECELAEGKISGKLEAHRRGSDLVLWIDESSTSMAESVLAADVRVRIDVSDDDSEVEEGKGHAGEPSAAAGVEVVFSLTRRSDGIVEVLARSGPRCTLAGSAAAVNEILAGFRRPVVGLVRLEVQSDSGAVEDA